MAIGGSRGRSASWQRLIHRLTQLVFGSATFVLTLTLYPESTLPFRLVLSALGLYVGDLLFKMGTRTRRFIGGGPRSYRQRQCKNCGRHISRADSAWISQCGSCGWTEGRPVIRWLTHSALGRSFRRHLSSLGELLAVLLIVTVLVLLLGATVGTGVGYIDRAAAAIKTAEISIPPLS